MSLANATAQAQKTKFRRNQICRHPNLFPADECLLNAGEGRIQRAAKVGLAGVAVIQVCRPLNYSESVALVTQLTQ